MPDQFQLDFSELSIRDRPGYGFQALIGDIGRVLGYTVSEGGTGPDRGKDLIFDVPYEGLLLKRERKKWLVSCKDYATSGRSVSRADVATAYGDVGGHKVQGFLLACTTQAGNDVVEMLEGWETGERPIATHIWNRHSLENLLHKHEDEFRLTLTRYFPNSYGVLSRSSDVVLDQLVQLLEDKDSSEIIEHAVKIAENDHDNLVRWRIAEILLNKEPSFDSLYELFDMWKLDLNRDFASGIGHLLCEYFSGQPGLMNEIGDALHNDFPTMMCKLYAVSAEIYSVVPIVDDDDLILRCTGSAEGELKDYVDKDCVNMSLPCSFTIRITGDSYEIEEVDVENPSDLDYEAELTDVESEE